MHFTKLEGCANDFIVVRDIPEDQINAGMQDRAIALCDRRRGIGADGLIFVLPSDNADWKMRILNADGSEPEMCGNGIRCFGIYLKHHNLTAASSLTIDTLAGIKTITICDDLVKVAMGAPILSGPQIPTTSSKTPVIMEPLSVNGTTYLATAISMGNPHAVIYDNDLSDALVLGHGPLLEKHPFFPAKANIEFIRVESPSEITMRVWERGCGETMACGTGACASVVAGIINKKHGNDVTVHLLGGDLRIQWDGDPTHEVYMTGPAHFVFDGIIA